jgi:hypothetical protein
MAQHSISQVAAVAPSQPGALAGFQASCSCGLVMRSSMESSVRLDVIEHVDWAARQGEEALRSSLRQVAAAAPLMAVEPVEFEPCLVRADSGDRCVLEFGHATLVHEVD